MGMVWSSSAPWYADKDTRIQAVPKSFTLRRRTEARPILVRCHLIMVLVYVNSWDTLIGLTARPLRREETSACRWRCRDHAERRDYQRIQHPHEEEKAL